MNELEEYLAQAGFSPRAPQTALFEHLITATNRGVQAQAGTGTGKSAAILAAAANRARVTGTQSIVITPTLTLMNQYRDGDMPVAREAYPDLSIVEVRGMAHYDCEATAEAFRQLSLEYAGGCQGGDVGCTTATWKGHTDSCPEGCDENHGGHQCGYRQAKFEASEADVVVTNADMLIVNDKILAQNEANFLSLDGALFVDEAHTLEQKLRDFASRSVYWKSAERFAFAGTAGPTLGEWIERNDQSVDLRHTKGFPVAALDAIVAAEMPPSHKGDGLTKSREFQEACTRIQAFMRDPHDSAVLHVGRGSLKMDWINVAKSSGELLRQRSFGLVSATLPGTMAATLGVPDAPFIDVGHPFDYQSQAWIGFSNHAGDYRSAQVPQNFDERCSEVMDLIRRSGGGALLLFSSFLDMQAVSDRLAPQIKGMGLTVLRQDPEGEAADRQRLADQFKSDGNAVLFGSESFATGFDVPGSALRLVVIWKLPYPAMDPVSNAIKSNSFARYNDLMTVRAVQGIGRLIRTATDKGIVYIADSRGRRLMNPRDPLTSHLPTFARL